MPHPPPDIPDARAEARAGRDRGLDLLRAAALVRVVIWHATGAAAVTVAGGHAGDVLRVGQPLRRVGRAPGRRGGRSATGSAASGRRSGCSRPVAWLLMAVAARVTGTVARLVAPAGVARAGHRPRRLAVGGRLAVLAALVPAHPAVDPAAGAGAGLAGPPGAGGPARRRRPGRRSCSSGSTGASGGIRRFAPRLAWQAGDVVLFGLFFAFGMWTRSPGADRGRSGPRRSGASRRWSAGAVAVGVWVALPPPGGVVNDSHVVHLVVGATLLFAVLAAAGPIGRLAERPWLRPGVDLLGRRSLTVYLWHTAAIAGALWVLARLGSVGRRNRGARLRAAHRRRGDRPHPRHGLDGGPRRPPGPAAAAAHAAVVGRRAGRGRRLAPARRGGAWPPLVLVAAVGLPLVGGRAAAPAEAAFRPRVPSQAPPLPSIVSLSDEPEWWTRPVTIDPVALERTLADWAAGERRGRRLGRRHHP